MSTSKRKQNGRFQSGASGNPKGRPPGSRNQATLAYEQILDDRGQALLLKAMEMAEQGNIHALRLCIERILPPRKERCVRLPLRPVVNDHASPLHFVDIVTAVALGDITPGEGKSVSAMLANRSKNEEHLELERRLANLETFTSDLHSGRLPAQDPKSTDEGPQ